jgi:hypothetical protein
VERSSLAFWASVSWTSEAALSECNDGVFVIARRLLRYGMRRLCRDLSSDIFFVHFGEGLRLMMLSVCLSCLYTPVLVS